MGKVYQNISTPEIVCEEEAYDYVSYIITTGNDYWNETPTEEARKDREDFRKEFPEYQDKSCNDLQKLPDEEKGEIIEWFFSGNWIATELEEGKEMELFL